jgi:hypothetical protein
MCQRVADEQRTNERIQRWRDRRHHYDHGARDEGSTWLRARRAVAIGAVFGSYVLSFVYVAIYWNNHHHLLHAVRSIDGRILWANLHLLFWLSLIPFCSGWMGENHLGTLPVALYGAVLLMCGIAYYILSRLLIRAPWARVELGGRVGQRPEGDPLTRALRRRHRAILLQRSGRFRHLRACGRHLVHSRSSDRESA